MKKCLSEMYQFELADPVLGDLFIFKLCSTQLSSANTPSLYQHSGQKPKNVFIHILVQTKTSLRPFRILPTFRAVVQWKTRTID